MASDEAVGMVMSNLAYLCGFVVLLWKGLHWRYWFVLLFVSIAIILSSMYHACHEIEISYCPQNLDVLQHSDVMAAFNALVFSLVPFIDQWCGGHKVAILYSWMVGVLTVFLVTEFKDGLESTIPVGIGACVVFSVMLYKEFRRRKDADGVSGLWWLNFFVLLGLASAALICYIIAKTLTRGTTEWRTAHSLWHMFGGFALACGCLLLSKEEPPMAMMVLSPTGPSVATSKTKYTQLPKVSTRV